MEQKRVLAAILFADIIGYTATMQKDEDLAMAYVNKHTEVLEECAKTNHGEVIKYLGDGSLSIFSSALAAVNCAIRMQQKFQSDFKVPIRIGIHVGEILRDKGDVYGDGVNIAARIQSLGTEGSVLISKGVFEKIKNQKEFKTTSLGHFELKNVEEPMAIHAVNAKGLSIPDRKHLSFEKGKLVPENTNKSQSSKSEVKILQSLWKRGVPQLLAGYFVAIWIVLQFSDWILSRFSIITFWTDLFAILFISLIPSVTIYIYHRERINLGRLNLFEKISFPTNFLIAIILMITLFNKLELNAMTKDVIVVDEYGNSESIQLINDQFATKIGLFPFKNETANASVNWLENGFPLILDYDLGQLDYMQSLRLSPNKKISLSEMIEISKKNNAPHFMSGTFSKNAEEVEIHTFLYKTESGEMLHEDLYKGSDIFELIDAISTDSRLNLGMSNLLIKSFSDLPIKDHLTNNIKALEFFSDAFTHMISSKIKVQFLDKALHEDSTFAIAGLVKAKYLYAGNKNKDVSIKAIDLAMRHRKRLSRINEIDVRANYYRIHEQKDKALSLLKMFAKLKPNDTKILASLYTQYLVEFQLEEGLEIAKKLVESDNSPTHIKLLVKNYLWLHETNNGLKILLDYIREYPQDAEAYTLLGQFYLEKNELQLAEEAFSNAILLQPENEDMSELILDHILFKKSSPTSNFSLSKFEGNYHLDQENQEISISKIKDLLFLKIENQAPVLQYPTSQNTIISADGFYKTTIVIDELGKVYQAIFDQKDRKNPIYGWIQDNSINAAMELLADNDFVGALKAFKQAYSDNPQHYYLANYIQHLEFILSPEYETNKIIFDTYVGQYGDREIFKENNEYFYHFNSKIPMKDLLITETRSIKMLLPISETRFMLPDNFQLIFEVQKKGNNVLGIKAIYQDGSEYSYGKTKLDS